MSQYNFTAQVVIEGSKQNSARIAVPAKLVKQMTDAGWQTPGWCRICVDDCEPFFAYARRPPSRSSVDLTLLNRVVGAVVRGQTVACVIEDAAPYRARPWTDQVGFDWLPFVDDRYFPTETLDGQLVLHNRHEEPFAMARVTPLNTTYRMLGWYQAEGSKGETAVDFSFANSNPAALAHYTRLLNLWGIPRERRALTVLREAGEDPANARAAYAEVDAVLAAERVRTGKGERAGVVQVRKSFPLLLLVRAALAHVFKCEWPTRDAAREYALGWLDGDGSITIKHRDGCSIELRLAGHESEQRISLHALEHAFAWQLNDGLFGPPRHHTSRALRLDQAADLAAADIFPFSRNRARLLWALGRRINSVPGGRSLTKVEHSERARMIFQTQLATEWQTLMTHELASQGFTTGEKGAAYPSSLAKKKTG